MTRRPLLRRLATATAPIAAVGAALLLAACSGSTTSPSTSSPSATSAGAVSSGSVSAAADSLDLSGVTLRIGETGYKQQQLLLEKAGLADTPYTTDFSLFQGGNLQLEALGAGAIDLASASEIPPIFAAQSGGPGSLAIVAVRQGNTLTQEVVVPEGSSITDAAGLKGKKVAYVQNTTAHYFLYKALEQAGLSWSDIEAVPLSTSDGLAALLSGQVDALASYGNAIISAHAKGASTIVDARDILSGNFVYVSTPTVIDDPAKHAAIADYFSRLQRAFNWARANPDTWAAVVAEQTKQPVEQALSTFTDGEAQRPSKFVPTSAEAIASQQDVLDTFVKAGILTTGFSIGDYWSTSFDADLTAIEGEYVGG
ncbi:ABC transporter substrate-binding protein [Nakamurella multipartita]|jgi:sulfonate transport system substrate-binding protein|uniref:Extracellular solute-binding protein family 3 n=1 Tax=Nakamurella multipartita (strain ATCC 700099 / DSM 44233 / CIP 104796 / JCM 9543 / NBRC 105858 / Y-104) TaxID=479431 RepID=C8XJR4_NAKMY|nr:ABC transporter substrate-binding protein [Nakamurella multipartita]ACV80625.1 extracellular solute-binding protein family 3 [Nakamurella multipartita DSM 44233]